MNKILKDWSFLEKVLLYGSILYGIYNWKKLETMQGGKND